MISVYQNQNGFRVVAGPHKPASEHAKLAPRTYNDASAAHAIETNPSIRHALVMLGAVPDRPAHIIKRAPRVGDIVTSRANGARFAVDSLSKTHVTLQGWSGLVTATRAEFAGFYDVVQS